MILYRLFVIFILVHFTNRAGLLVWLCYIRLTIWGLFSIFFFVFFVYCIEVFVLELMWLLSQSGLPRVISLIFRISIIVIVASRSLIDLALSLLPSTCRTTDSLWNYSVSISASPNPEKNKIFYCADIFKYSLKFSKS